MDDFISYLPYVGSFFISLVITGVMIFVKIQDVPGMRSSHIIVTPRGGGLGIFIAYYAVWALRGLGSFPFPELLEAWILTLYLPALMGFIGLWDDIKGLGHSLRLMFQIIFAFVFIGFGFSIHTFCFPFVGEFSGGLFGLAVTMLWIIGFTNSFNFMDGLNGLASGTSMMAAFFWFLITRDVQSEALAFSSLVIVMANLGFIGFNFPRAYIFMGDVGSFFLGSLFAIWAIVGSYPSFGNISILTMPLLFFISLYDVIITRIRRLLKRHPFFEAHREHLYQLLNQIGWSHTQVTLTFMGFFSLQGILAYMMQRFEPTYHLYFFIPLFLLYSLFSYFILKKARERGVYQ